MLNEQMLQMGPMLLLAGLGAGWLADTLVLRSAYGLLVDMGLGVAASVIGGSALLALHGPTGGMLGMFGVGLLLATSAILGQRFFWPPLRGARERNARLRLLELGRPVGQQASASRMFQVGDGRVGQARNSRPLVRLAITGIYLLRGIPLELQRAARGRATLEGTTLRHVLLKGLGEYAAGTWTPGADEEPPIASSSIV